MKINNETKVGLLVIIVIAILASLTIKVGNFNMKKDGYTVRVQFNDIDGVNLNSPVMYNGYEVGIVDDIIIRDVDGEIKMELLLWLQEKARLRTGAKASVKNLGFMGEKYVGLTSGDANEPYLSEGALLMGDEPPSLNEIIAEGKIIAEKVTEVLTNINGIVETNSKNIDELLVNTNDTMKKLSSVAGNVDGILADNKENIGDIVSNLENLSVNLEEMSSDLKEHPWKIMYRSKDK